MNKVIPGIGPVPVPPKLPNPVASNEEQKAEEPQEKEERSET